MNKGLTRISMKLSSFFQVVPPVYHRGYVKTHNCVVKMSSKTCCQQNGVSQIKEASTFESVQKYYGQVLSTSKDLKTNACTASGKPHPIIGEKIAAVPEEIRSKFYGCGAPLPLGIKDLRVLDLGSGSGRDCYVCSALVGDKGFVTGLDMTDEQLEVARKYVESYCTETLGYSQPNMKFVKGNIEYLDKAGIEDESIDIIISNCVVNLSPDKPRVIEEAYRVLAPGGELYFSDVYCDRRLPEHVQKDEVLWGECISGALYIEDFKRIAGSVGFKDVRVLQSSEMAINDQSLKDVLGNARFYSITYRLFKIPDQIETLCEDYGQIAIYKGTIKGHKHSYTLDDHHHFITNKPMLVCGNTAAMVGEGGVSWLSPHFEVIGDRSVHYGLFDCNSSSKIVSDNPASNIQTSPSDGGCCS
eukprot:TRINITY_DN1801_c0_g1_i2.p1 TRINITY_DN1801_c0_g1~~TRINITY_DN1801_c0_g1_i2.p1  ORF type:complete len:415 (-),score=47.41 TRINITY_DN1801_c0_g1_i2:372-1616(-)